MRFSVGDMVIVIAAAPDERQRFLGYILRICGVHNPATKQYVTAPQLTVGDLNIYPEDDCLKLIKPDADADLRELEMTQ